MTGKGIEEIFKSAFNNFEADVDPSVWTNVQQAINAPQSAPSNDGTNGSVAGKAGALAGKLGVKAIVTIVAAAAGVSVATYFILSDAQNHKANPTTASSVKQIVPAVQQQQAAIANESLITKNKQIVNAGVNKNIAQQSAKKNEKGVTTSEINNTKPLSSAPISNAAAAKDITTMHVANPKQATQPKPAAVTNAAPSVSAKENTAKQEEREKSDESRTFQNDFADINNYLEPESSTGKIALPNVFSPNGDGRNDEFKIKTKNLQSLVVTVFDMSGKQVYQWNGLDGKWDGNLPDGRPAPVGNYYYSLLAVTTDGKHCIASSPLMLRRY